MANTLELRVEFKGLCAFVERQSDHSITVFLPLTPPHFEPDAETPHHEIPHHIPLLVVPLEHVDPKKDKTSPPDFIISTPPDDQHFACWNVTGCDIGVTDTAVKDASYITFERKLDLKGDPAHPDFPVLGLTWPDRAWVPDMARLLDKFVVNPDCFGEQRPAFLTGRWKLTSGRMRCRKPKNETARTQPVEFVTTKGAVPGVAQVFSDRVQYSVSIDGDEITIAARNSKGTRTVVLNAGPNDEHRIDVVLSHLPNRLPSDTGVIDSHFRLYYDLLTEASKPEDPPLPRPLGTDHRGGILIDCDGLYMRGD